MICKCGSDRIITVSGKTSDMFGCDYGTIQYNGYVPEKIGITDGEGCGDYIGFSYCLECGKIQGNFPISDKQVKTAIQKMN